MLKTVSSGMFLLAMVFPAVGAPQGDHADNHATPLQSVTPAGSQAAVYGSENYFTGRVRVDPLFIADEHINANGAYVTFEPGARSAWHTHPAGQKLVVTSGVGLTQEAGQPIKEIRPGDVIWCPPGVKHWHGAAPGCAMTHLAISGIKNGKSVEWMEKVSDDEYNAR